MTATPGATTAGTASHGGSAALRPEPDLLSTEAALKFWDERHRRESELRSGGDIGLDEATNEAFYARRLGTLLELCGDRNSLTTPLSVLDAGCGKGWFAERVARCGFLVDAVDASPAAVSEARASGSGEVSYRVSTLGDLRSAVLYDIVYVMDVVFHIIDDAEWAKAVQNLASMVKPSGLLIVTDRPGPGRQRRGDYIVHREVSEYDALLAPYGLIRGRVVPYRFRANEIAFIAYAKAR